MTTVWKHSIESGYAVRQSAPCAVGPRAVLLSISMFLCACSPKPETLEEFGDQPVKDISAEAAQQLANPIPVPEMEACTDNESPVLPDFWQSGAILQHFSDRELVIGNLVFDSAVQALRFTLRGTDHRRQHGLVEASSI